MMETKARFPFSLADGIVLVQCLGLTLAANIVRSVDPWRYPDEETPATIGVKSYLQGAVDKATQEGNSFCRITEESLTAYLLSPLLLPKGERPPLVRISTGDAKRKTCAIPVELAPRLIARAKSQRASPVEVPRPPFLGTSPLPPTPEVKRLGEDGVAYTKAEFDEYYGDLDTALQFWTAADGVALAAAPKPLERFAPGSIVRVLPDSRPGVRPEHAEGLLSQNTHAEEVHEGGEVF
jgi:hypothetical protein